MEQFDNDAHNAFISERFAAETERRDRLAAFDKFVDLALEGVITMDEALKAFKEESGIEVVITPIPKG